MKKALLKFANHLLSKEAMRNVKGGLWYCSGCGEYTTYFEGNAQEVANYLLNNCESGASCEQNP